MTGWITSALVSLAALATNAAAQEGTIVVGAVVSESGAHAAGAEDYRRGMLLWQDEINASGGLLGERVVLRIEDDGSEAVRAGEAYAELVRQGVPVFIGPYGSAATLTGAAEAERARRVMLNAAGPSSAIHKRSPHYVFQTSPPYTAYADGPVALAREAGVSSLYILGRDDVASREMAEAAQTQARRLGLAKVEIDIYAGSTVDFLPQLYKAMAQEADGWIAFGEARDEADMVKTLKRHGYVPKMLYARASIEPRFVSLIGQDAEFILGTEEYDARFPTTGNAEFVKAFTAKWSVAPGALAAAAYAAGTVLAEGVRRAGSVDGQKLRAVLATLEVDTVLGRYRVDPATGAQVGMQPVVVQRMRGRERAVWPSAVAGEAGVAPFAPWAGRQILK